MTYLVTHWRGEQSLNRSFWLNGVLLRILAYGTLALLTWAQPLPKPILYLAIGTDLLVLTWQSVGFFRSAEHSLSGSSSMLPLWGGIIAFVVAVFIVLSQWWGLVLAANPPPEEEPFSVKMDRLRAAQYDLTVDDQGLVMTFEGDVTYGVKKRVAALLVDNPSVQTLNLNSSGGNIFEARGLAKLIISAGLDTHVSEHCSSACTIMLMAGIKRSASDGAKIGFHRYALEDAARLPQFDVEAEQNRDRVFFEKRGVDQGFLQRIYDSSNQEIWFPTRDELLQASVLHAGS